MENVFVCLSTVVCPRIFDENLDDPHGCVESSSVNVVIPHKPIKLSFVTHGSVFSELRGWEAVKTKPNASA